jgi:undecaprenyl-diphosphatase
MLVSILYWNFWVFRVINQSAGQNSVIDTVMIFVANDLIVIWPLLLLALWFVPAAIAGGKPTTRLEARRILLLAVLAAGLALGIDTLLGAAIFEPRPFIGHHVHDLIAHSADSAFPSDHTAVSFAVAIMLWHLPDAGRSVVSGRWIAPRLLALLALAVAVFIGIARIYTGLHYPDDVVVGALVGLFSAECVFWLRPLLDKPVTMAIHLAQRVHLA